MNKILIIVFILLMAAFPEQTHAVKKVPILIYHSIEEYSGYGQKELYVRPENFEKQMTYLRDHGFTLLTFERWADKDKVNKPIFLTFDDGYKNNLNVFYIFQRLKSENFNPTGTFFIIADFIERPNRLSPSDLKMLANSGLISIQSHTATHPELTKITHDEYELNHSKKKIEQITGKPVIALAYPYGDYDEKVVAETKKYYTYGLTTTPGPYIKTGIDNELYLLPRTYIKYSTTLDEFAEIVETK